MDKKTALVFPCYNEEKRLNQDEIYFLIDHTDSDIFLVNDGSTDRTIFLMEEIRKYNPERIQIIDYTLNQGKAQTIFKAINTLNSSHNYKYIGYFDADFSTSASEIIRMLHHLKQEAPKFLIGSRILMLNHDVKRKAYRHYIGRMIITLINLKHHLLIYDTQCGAKFFSSEIIKVAFKKPFLTSWLFDTEVFIRLKKENLLKGGSEFPLLKWYDVGGSKLGLKSIFKIAKELWIVLVKY